jgi:hypothetical protein
MGPWRYSFKYFKPSDYELMDFVVQFRPDNIGNSPQYQLDTRPDGLQCRSGRFGEKKNILHLPESKAEFSVFFL